MMSNPDVSKDTFESDGDRQHQLDVMEREFNWTTYESERLIDRKELGLLLDYDKQSIEQQRDLLHEKGVQYATMFVHALTNIVSKDVVEYLIYLVDHLLEDDSERAKLFYQIPSQKNEPVDPAVPFLRLITSPELGYHPSTLARTCHILSVLLAHAPQENSSSMVNFLRYLVHKLISSTTSSRDQLIALTCLKSLLRRRVTQELFRDADGLKALANLCNKETQNAQLLYLVGFNIWLLSYHYDISKQLQELGVIRKVVSIVKVNVMEKVIRICYSALRNLLDHKDDTFAEEMIGHGLLQINDTLSKRKFKDPDVMIDINFITEVLQQTIQRLSTFEMYTGEVVSGNLQWSPAHKNEQFWRENISQFEQQNYKLIQKLIELLTDDEDLTREIACYDLGEFARFHSEGKKIITRLGGKTKLMLNLSHRNPKVAKAALLATQKLMVDNWEFLAKSSSGGVTSLVGQKK